MPSATLRAICIQKTCKLLKSGVWERCPENPFSSMRSSVIQDLLSSMLPAHSKLSRACIASSRLLLTCGRLEYVDLLSVEEVEDYVSLFRKLSLGCQNLRRLLLPQFGEISNCHVERALRDLLTNCSDLEEIHSNFYFDPEILRNHPRLRSLRLHFCDPEAIKFTRSVTDDVLQHLGSIEVFAICTSIHFKTAIEEEGHLPCITRILDNCPRLTSVGYMDSSVALKQLNHHFQLRNCYWISEYCNTLSGYSDMIQVAVQSCPLLKALVIGVRDAGCLKHLGALANLTSLDITFYDCVNKYDQKFYGLLKEIGPQLEYLALYGYLDKRLDLDVVCDLCPNLSTLQVQCGITVGDGASLMHLKQLNACEYGREDILSLLSNCLSVKVLYLDLCEALEDDVLHEILGKNSFAELEVAHIDNCSLSESGLMSFISIAPKLREFSLGSPAFLNDDDVMRCVRKLNPSCRCLPVDRVHSLNREVMERFSTEGFCGF